jgi:hypothetical protein
MLPTYLHRQGQIPTSVHPFVKCEQTTKQIQAEKQIFWYYRFVPTFHFILTSSLQFIQRQFHRNS